MRKSIFSIALCLLLLLSMSTTTFAASSRDIIITCSQPILSPLIDSSLSNSVSNSDIKVTYSQASPDSVIFVDIAWGSMEFNYDSGDTKVWNPKTLQYDIVKGEGEGTWTPKNENGDTIIVTNHSNMAISAELSFTPADNGVIGVTGTFTETSGTENDNVLELATANGTTVEAAPSATACFGISSGAITETNVTLGTITVTISDASNIEEETGLDAMTQALTTIELTAANNITYGETEETFASAFEGITFAN